jgi:hypothetical protein
MGAREQAIPAAAKVRGADALERIVPLVAAWDQLEKAVGWSAKRPPGFAERPADVFARS